MHLRISKLTLLVHNDHQPSVAPGSPDPQFCASTIIAAAFNYKQTRRPYQKLIKFSVLRVCFFFLLHINKVTTIFYDSINNTYFIDLCSRFQRSY